MSTPDPFDLGRFVLALEGVDERACRELRAGRKTTRWMWFVFQQMRGLGRGCMAWDFGISSLEEARGWMRRRGWCSSRQPCHCDSFSQRPTMDRQDLTRSADEHAARHDAVLRTHEAQHVARNLFDEIGVGRLGGE